MDKQTGSVSKNSKTTRIAVIGSLIIALIMVLGTVWVVQSAQRDNEKAVRSVSVLYLDELAGRREQVVENNLQNKIRDLRTAVSLMSDEDLSDMEHLQAYQARIKRLFLVAFLRMFATSVISTMKVLWPLARSSLAPTRVNILSQMPIFAESAGTNDPI